MIQPRDDKKNKDAHGSLRIRQVMMDLDIYLRVFIIPQIPAEYKEFREEMRETMNRAWHEMYLALQTSKRERQKSILKMKVEMAMVETYLHEIREVCYRGKAKKKLDKNSARRFEVAGQKEKEVMHILWGWAKNEDRKMDTSKNSSVSGLVDEEEVNGTPKE